jgi:putative phosphoribosyl transferase
MVGMVGLAPKELDSSDMTTRDSLQPSTDPPRRQSVIIGDQALEGDLAIPPVPCGLIIFAHGSGSSRRSPRNVFVASSLQHRGFATLLFDLLTEDEAADRANVFDIGLLARRVRDAVLWSIMDTEIAGLPIGLFGASTGAAAALVAAAEPSSPVAAVVSRGGRPDLAGAALDHVRAPVLLIVGGEDTVVLYLNRNALRRLACTKQLDIIPGATHLFEEPGTLEAVVNHASAWFATHCHAHEGAGR